MNTNPLGRVEKQIKTNEDWYPTDNGEVRVLMTRLFGEPEIYRVAVWGGDDFGLEFDHPDKNLVEEYYELIGDYVTQQELKDLGFQNA